MSPISMVEDGYDIDVTPNGLFKIYRKFLMLGYTPAQAGNFVATLLGLHSESSSRPWTIAQINQMIFLKHIRDTIVQTNTVSL